MRQELNHNNLIILALNKYTALSLKELSHVTSISLTDCKIGISKLLDQKSLTFFVDRKVTFYTTLIIQNEDKDFSVLKDLPQSKSPLSESRTCYSHLAGKLGTTVTEQLVKKGLINEETEQYCLTKQGYCFFQDFSLTNKKERRKRKSHVEDDPSYPSGKKCLDWTQRKFHLGGELGQLLTQNYLKLGWIKQSQKSRAVIVTEKGIKEFKKLGI